MSAAQRVGRLLRAPAVQPLALLAAHRLLGELATELGCPPEKMADSALMNMWLHSAVLRKLAENGGKVPRDLLD